MNEYEQAGQANYKHRIREGWAKISELGEEYRYIMLAGKQDSGEIKNTYVSALSSFWLVLYPKVKGREEQEDWKEIAEEFMSYEKYHIAAEKLVEDIDMTLKITRCYSEILEKLKITTFDEG